jgi:hypothetical protein
MAHLELSVAETQVHKHLAFDIAAMPLGNIMTVLRSAVERTAAMADLSHPTAVFEQRCQVGATLWVWI